MQPNTKLEQRLLPLAEAAGNKLEMNALGNPDDNGWLPKCKGGKFNFQHLAYRIAQPALRDLLALAEEHGVTLNMVRAIAAKAKWAREDAKQRLSDGATFVDGALVVVQYNTNGSVQ